MRQLSTAILALLTLLSTITAPATVAAQSAAVVASPPPAAAHLLISDETGIVVELIAPDYTIVDDNVGGVTCQRIIINRDDGDYIQSAVTGAPQLPIHIEMVGVPSSGTLNLAITELQSETVRTDYHACPSPEIVMEWDGLEPGGDENSATYYVERDAEFDSAIYDQPTLYPIAPAHLEDVVFIRSQRAARLVFSPFQVNPVDGALLVHQRIVVNLEVDSVAAQQADRAPESLVQEPPEVDRLLNAILINGESARKWRTVPQSSATSATANAEAESVSANTRWNVPRSAWRIFTTENGLHKLSYDDLTAAGMNMAEIQPDNLRMYYDGWEIAVEIDGAGDGAFDPGDQIIFYAQTTDETYAAANVYWLAHGNRAGKRMAVRPSASGASANPAESYIETIRLERNLNYVSSLPMEPGYDHWYDNQLTAVGPNGVRSLDTPLLLSQLAPQGGDASLTMAVAGNVKGRHHLKFYVNDVEVYEDEWENRTYRELSVSFDPELLKEGINFIRLELINDTPNQALDMIYIDWVSLGYPRDLVAGDGQFHFDGPGPGLWSYDVSGLVDDEAQLFDITNPIAVSRINVSAQNQQLSFGDSQPNARQYALCAPDQLLTPAKVEAAVTDNLAADGADYIMIAPGEFFDALQPLADYRAEQGYRVRMVDVQDIYDQFAFGRTSAAAIRDFLAHAYHNWTAPAPNFVLLVGDGNYDPKRYLDSSTETIIPPYLEMVDPALGETAADNRFVTVSGDDIVPDMNLGRFPAKTADDVIAMVEKTIGYEQVPANESWLRNLLFIADDLEGGGGAFQNYSNAIADGETTTLEGDVVPLVPRDYHKTKLYLDDHCPDGNPALECRQSIIDQMNEGVFFVSYIGHGSKQFWAAEQLLNLDALSQLNNKDHLPIMLPMTCLEGFYHDADVGKDAFGESIVRMPNDGAVASWSPTGLGLVSGHDYLEKGFMLAVFHYNFREIGFATHYGKMRLVTHGPGSRYDDLIDTFVLFGDPALRMNYTPDAAGERVFLPFISNN